MNHPVDRTKHLDRVCEGSIDVRPLANVGEDTVEATTICGCRLGD
jgi:hypothetical protein